MEGITCQFTMSENGCHYQSVVPSTEAQGGEKAEVPWARDVIMAVRT